MLDKNIEGTRQIISVTLGKRESFYKDVTNKKGCLFIKNIKLC